MDNNNFGRNDDDDNPLNEWIQRRDTENVRRAREQFAEERLPISYGAMNTEEEDTKTQQIKKNGAAASDDENDSASKKMGQFGPLKDTQQQQAASFQDAINATSSTPSSSPCR